MSWVAGIALMAVAFVYQEELRSLAGIALGLPQAEMQSARSAEQPRAREERRAGGIVEIPAGRTGHFFATAEINGRSVEVMVDSGASVVAMPYEDAERAGVYVKDSDFTARASTANGIARIARVTLDRVSIGDITVRNVQAAVHERGQLDKTLLGMSFLGRLQRADMRSGTLVLQE
jgi:aspartyl protease family protein